MVRMYSTRKPGYKEFIKVFTNTTVVVSDDEDDEYEPRSSTIRGSDREITPPLRANEVHPSAFRRDKREKVGETRETPRQVTFADSSESSDVPMHYA